MLVAKDFRSNARAALKGHWLYAGGAALVAGLLGGATAQSTPSVSFSENIRENVTDAEVAEFFLRDEFAIILLVLMGIGLVMLLWMLLGFVIGGATTLGYAKFNLKLVDGEDARIQDVLSQYNRIGTGFCMQFLRGLYVVLWSLLFSFLGVVASYRYSMTPYILVENPGMTAGEAIKESKRLMKGNKLRLFCLEISFFGWSLLAVLFMALCMAFVLVPMFLGGRMSIVILGLPALFVIFIAYTIIIRMLLVPYVEASKAVFYREIKEQRYSKIFFDNMEVENFWEPE